MKFRLWGAFWNDAVKAVEPIWDVAGGNLDKICEGIEAVKYF